MSYYYDDYDEESDYEDYWSEGPRTIRTVLGLLAGVLLIVSAFLPFFGVIFPGATSGDSWWILYNNGEVDTDSDYFPDLFNTDPNGLASHPGAHNGTLEDSLQDDYGKTFPDDFGTTNPFLEYLQEGGKNLFGTFGFLSFLFYPNIMMILAAVLTLAIAILRKTDKASSGVLIALKIIALIFFFLSFWTMVSLVSVRGGFLVAAATDAGMGSIFNIYSGGFFLGIIGGIMSFFS
ncbi:MAG: hypothetical protein ACTSYA_01280 [Candidatus Kariarchaeaceae archaeon]